MATAKVRIFELAKELGISSKELIGLFDRLGLEAKNQLSVVDDKIADLVRGVLLRKGQPAAAPAPVVPAAPVAAAVAPPAAPPIAQPEPVAATLAPEPEAQAAPTPAPRPAIFDEAPVPVLRPVPPISRRQVPARQDPAVANLIEDEAEDVETQPIPPLSRQPEVKPVVAAPKPPPPPRPRTTFDTPIPQLRPVLRAPGPAARPATPPPKPGTTVPGRPGVVPRPGQPSLAAPQASTGAPSVPARPPAPARPARPNSNGPFRPLAPPPGGATGTARPFTPRPASHQPSPNAANGAGSMNVGPTPSSGAPGRGGNNRGHDRESAAAKRDREKELLLEKERQRKKRSSLDAAPAVLPTVLENIEIPDVLTVQELATSMIIPAKDVIKELIKMGTMATINQNIPSDTAIAVAKKFGFNAVVKEAGDEVMVEQEEDRPEMLSPRPPVVTVLGHVDHGKTSLLDKIRRANVAGGEAGGITQRIGAYTVEKDDRKITFIDTPGHEAFTAMRARGAKVTDVAILVVAADDGVMPQTIEAISHIRAADVPIVVAINKIDKEGASIDRVKQQLTEQGLQPVDWGGKTEMVPISARQGIGIDQLLETVLLEADLRELKANKNRRATGVVIESALDRGRGAVATVLVQNGTLRVGDVVVVGGAYGKIRALNDDKGKQVKKAGPSIPVEIMGLSDVPSAGDALMVVSDERIAREAAAKRSTKRRDTFIASNLGPRVSLESFMAMPADGAAKTLNLVIKADGQGSVEALRSRVQGLSVSEVEIRVIFAGVGGITPNDVNLASASNAVLIGFNIRPDETVKRLAENEKVDLRFYQVIYDVENDLRRALVGMLAPKYREVILGRAEVREVFKVSKVGTIAGCYIKDGKLTRHAKVRVIRDSVVVFDGELESLRRFKDDVKDVAEGYECGVQVAKFADLKVGDILEAHKAELIAPELANV